MEEKEKILEVSHLKKYFKTGRGTLKAVDDVSFFIRKGETLGIVGESGCGKTTCGRTCIGIHNKTDGHVLYKGKDVHSLRGKERKEFTKEVQIIFQDPYSSLDPKMKVGDIIAEGLKAHHMCKSREEEQARVKELLETVGLNAEHATRYVHEFSGGQRQRIGIARALAVEPEFIVCDEPISALDVSIQAQIVNLFGELKEKLGLTYLFIAHDLSMVRHISDRVGVMYLGMMAEMADSRELYENPRHPYTKALLSAIPSTDPDQPMSGRRIRMEGEVGSPVNPPAGCRFASRCPWATDRCRKEMPLLRQVAPGHFCACHLEERQGT